MALSQNLIVSYDDFCFAFLNASWGIVQLGEKKQFLLSFVINNCFCWILSFSQFHKVKFLY